VARSGPPDLASALCEQAGMACASGADTKLIRRVSALSQTWPTNLLDDAPQPGFPRTGLPQPQIYVLMQRARFGFGLFKRLFEPF
jgi:hypothetical protein